MYDVVVAMVVMCGAGMAYGVVVVVTSSGCVWWFCGVWWVL